MYRRVINFTEILGQIFAKCFFFLCKTEHGLIIDIQLAHLAMAQGWTLDMLAQAVPQETQITKKGV